MLRSCMCFAIFFINDSCETCWHYFFFTLVWTHVKISVHVRHVTFPSATTGRMLLFFHLFLFCFFFATRLSGETDRRLPTPADFFIQGWDLQHPHSFLSPELVCVTCCGFLCLALLNCFPISFAPFSPQPHYLKRRWLAADVIPWNVETIWKKKPNSFLLAVVKRDRLVFRVRIWSNI